MKAFILLLLALTFSGVPAQAQMIVQQQVEFSATTTSSMALAANPRRKYLLVVNKGSATVLLKFGSANTGSIGVPIPAGGNYEPYQVPLDKVYLLSSSGTQTVLLIEGE